ncbi:G protein-coupled receptor, rhodopsin-like family and GPCR, rhodopsin-like, 7TM domain-containing protein [Strongyloides ratti]|uniref:Serpentine receptor class gamma n=1 Tax=Strongyloides ratti TaxID=34506 RepID=A0A090LK58_STRRB|nr:G protein-coupled receptor, rhodopsin-like family and GPCR, rhodopsin-like, 7TM domain-containing protein [Strongyloides ratti]CEF70098.1 G protein-coupled receptor, rhodopsin-like family and GPCR, rhodopsin-like, 7TM domain-containing protein [Strongyloides ratti]
MHIVLLFIGRFPKWNIFPEFYKNAHFLAKLLYVVVFGCFSTIVCVCFFISLNRYIATTNPLTYKRFFSKKNILKMIISILLLSSLIGLGKVFFNPCMVPRDIGGYFAVVRSKTVAYYDLSYTFLIYLPLFLLSLYFNFSTIYYLKKMNKKKKVLQKNKTLYLYGFAYIIVFNILIAYHTIVIVAEFSQNINISNLLIMINIYATDSMTIGLFYFMIFIR